MRNFRSCSLGKGTPPQNHNESTHTMSSTSGKSSCAFIGEEDDTAAWNRWGYLSRAHPASMPG